MKLKYFLTIPLGYLILKFTLNFSLLIFRYDVPTPLDDIIYICTDILAVIFLVYIYNKYILKQKLADISVCRPAPKLKWVAIAILLSTIVLCCCLFLTEGTFKRETLSREQTIHALTFTLLSAGLRTGITEELVFRGFIFRSLQKATGSKIAVVLSSVLFAAMHLPNIDTSNLYNVVSLLVAITIIGCAFALIVMETGSIWSTAAFHGIYNIISGDTDIIHVSTDQMFPAIWSYTPVKEYRWITGISGSDDIETGLPAMIGFTIVILLALYFIRKKKTAISQMPS